MLLLPELGHGLKLHRPEDREQPAITPARNSVIEVIVMVARFIYDFAKSRCEKMREGHLGVPHSSRSRIIGSTERARYAGIHVATRPSNAMAIITPPNTRGSRAVA